jgi:hypothetical protein
MAVDGLQVDTFFEQELAKRPQTMSATRVLTS